MQNQEQSESIPSTWDECKTPQQQAAFLYHNHWDELRMKISWWESDHPGILQLHPMEQAVLFATIGEIHLDEDMYSVAADLKAVAYDLIRRLAIDEELDRAIRFKMGRQIKTLLYLSEKFKFLMERIPSFERFTIDGLIKSQVV
jgi:hypothetical protein